MSTAASVSMNEVQRQTEFNNTGMIMDNRTRSLCLTYK